MKTDPFDLQRFLTAQEGVWERALAEIRSGRKRTHWMWYVFPQFAGLGFSSTTQFYAIQSRGEARAYLAHPLLGARLREGVQAALAAVRAGHTVSGVFGFPDDRKLQSCATLFALLPDADPVFATLLDTAFGGERDQETLRLLAENAAR